MRGIYWKIFSWRQGFDDVCFELRVGEAMALLGENDAGKSTLMKIRSGVYNRDAGEMEVFGRSYGDLTSKQA